MSDASVTTVFSFGGGVQGRALAKLICDGKWQTPDIAVIVDTEREKSATWAYLESVVAPALREAGVEIVRIPKSAWSSWDLVEKVKGQHGPLLPLYIADGGRLPAHCSSRWKKDVIKRFLRSLGVQQAEVWVGISTDEVERAKKDQTDWFDIRWPLIEMRMSRADCQGLLQRCGWPHEEPSSCWCCPNVRDWEWQEMRSSQPVDWASAVALERKIRSRWPRFFLHRQRVPLDQVDLSGGVADLFSPGCDSGFCFI